MRGHGGQNKSRKYKGPNKKIVFEEFNPRTTDEKNRRRSIFLESKKERVKRKTKKSVDRRTRHELTVKELVFERKYKQNHGFKPRYKSDGSLPRSEVEFVKFEKEKENAPISWSTYLKSFCF